MRKHLLLTLATLTAGASTAALAGYRGDINGDGLLTIADIAALVNVLQTSTQLTEAADVDGNGSVDLADLALLTDIVLGKTSPTPLPEPSAFNDTIIVAYDGTSATLSDLPTDGTITASVSGADVTITNTIIDREITTILRGTSTSGSLTYNGDYKTTVVLDGVTLKGSTREAVNIKCGKRIALKLSDGTANSLEDATTDGGQKAAFHTKGHLEVSGAGSLTLKGNVKHGLDTGEYLEIKKTAGTLTIASAAADGIHAGQYYQQNGGTIVIAGVGGDGIQAEATDTPDDDLNGRLIVKGGTLDITTTATDVAALKSDSLMTLTGGTFTLTTSGAAGKAIKSKRDLIISGGTYTISQSGKAVIEAGDLGYVCAIKGSDVSISGGTFNITTSGVGARGISAANLTIDEAADISITNTGAAGTLADAIEVTDSPTTDGNTDNPKSYKVYVAVPATSGGTRPGQTTTNPWSTVYLYKQDGTQVATLTQKVTVNNTSFYVYDFGTASSGTFYFGAPNYSSSSRPGSTATSYTIKTATFSGPTSGQDVYYSISSNYSISGTTRTYTLSNVTTQYEGGTVGGSSSTDSFTAKGLKIDGTAQLLGGTINIKMSGAGGKGIKVDGNYIQGREDGTGPTLTVATTGSKYNAGGTSSGGNTGGWGGPGGGFGGEDSSGSSAKAIKVVGTVVINGGTSEISTTSDGAEGLESKVKALGSITINGGQHYFHCYDDCINSAGGINFEGGTCVCYAYGNDAVDSNFGQSGAIVIGNGNALAYTTKGSPEEGFDCDNNSYIRITGTGNALGLGGAQGGGSSSGIGSATQGYVLSTTSLSLQTGRYYTLADSTGKNLFTFTVEAGFSSTMSLISATGMKSGSQYTLKYAATAPTDATTAWHGFYLGSTAQGTTSVTTLTAK